MIIGHAAIAFSVSVLLLGYILRWKKDRVLLVGSIALVFAFIPDIDIIYGVYSGVESVFSTASVFDMFWTGTNLYHRNGTHSLIIGFILSCIVTCTSWSVISFEGLSQSSSKLSRGTFEISLISILLFMYIVSVLIGPQNFIGWSIYFSYFFIGNIVTLIILRKSRANWKDIGLGSFIGLLSHPFGDLMIEPAPMILYPVSDAVLPVIRFSGDPTLNFMGIFISELFVLWIALIMWAQVSNWSISRKMSSLSVGGALHLLFVIQFPAPMLSGDLPLIQEYLYVLSLIFWSLLIASSASLQRAWTQESWSWERVIMIGVVNFLLSITTGVLSYTVWYVGITL